MKLVFPLLVTLNPLYSLKCKLYINLDDWKNALKKS